MFLLDGLSVHYFNTLFYLVSMVVVFFLNSSMLGNVLLVDTISSLTLKACSLGSDLHAF